MVKRGGSSLLPRRTQRTDTATLLRVAVVSGERWNSGRGDELLRWIKRTDTMTLLRVIVVGVERWKEEEDARSVEWKRRRSVVTEVVEEDKLSSSGRRRLF